MGLARNINFFGELLIYLAFALLAWTWAWAPLAVLALWIGFVWLPRMRAKERLLATLPGYEEYRRRSKYWIPFILVIPRGQVSSALEAICSIKMFSTPTCAASSPTAAPSARSTPLRDCCKSSAQAALRLQCLPFVRTSVWR